MKWANIESDLQAVFRKASGDAALQVRWKDTSGGNTYRDDPNGLVLDLSVVSVASVGRDERLPDDKEDGSNVEEYVYGARTFTLQLQAEADQQPYEAADLIDKILAGIHSFAVEALLSDSELTIARTGISRYVPYQDGYRQIGAAVAEIVFNAHTLVQLDDIPYVDRISGEGTYTLPNGAQLILPFDSVLS